MVGRGLSSFLRSKKDRILFDFSKSNPKWMRSFMNPTFQKEKS